MPVPTRPAYSSLPSSSWRPNKREPRNGRVPSGSDQPDEAFESVSIGGAAEGLAVAALMIAEFYPVGRFRKERSQATLSLAERKGPQMSLKRAAAVAGYLAVQSRPARVRSWMTPFSIRPDM